ncbi:MAG: hypothetical protein A3J24_05750 [Deltaproteobacteria bacterium RIFCSPLOWO2_02_FULL_53_8]|nr:MAG: hypothetical protein A3J24_05750 [Deltaproteobacteria bacterium RIFCSPLOWO2_02_FULL_53_8]
MDFVRLFEIGRRSGQIFPKKDVITYESYKEAIAAEEAKVTSLKAELEEWRRKARILGVPKTLWDE